MTQPTQAQIDAAVKAMISLGQPWDWRDMAEAALTAAAQVGEPHSVDFLEGVAEGKAATIERCAQVVYEIFQKTWDATAQEALRDALAAIRKLKDAP